MPGQDYLESLFKEIKEWLPKEVYKKLWAKAFPRAGARARWKQPDGPGLFEQLALKQLDAETFKDAEDGDVSGAWASLGKWYAAAVKIKDDGLIEKIISGAKVIFAEMKKRELKVKGKLLEAIGEKKEKMDRIEKGWEGEEKWDLLRYGVRDPEEFAGGFHAVAIGGNTGIFADVGTLEEDGEERIQAIRFDKKLWTFDRAKEWVAGHPEIEGGGVGEVVVIVAYENIMARGYYESPYARVETKLVVGNDDRSLWRINDAHGERYFLYAGGEAQVLGMKIPGEDHFYFEPILEKFNDRALINALGWSDAAWDKFLTEWFTTKKEDDDLVLVEQYCEIYKADDEKQIVYGVVMEPEEVDTQGEVVGVEEIEKTAHLFMQKYQTIGDQHKKKFKGGSVVESWLAPEAFTWKGQKIKKGSWLMGVHIEDVKKWAEVKEGKYTGFSIGGWAARE